MATPLEDLASTHKDHISIDSKIIRGQELARGRQVMVGVFRNERLLGIFNTEGEAKNSLLQDRKDAIKLAHMIEDLGFRYRIVRLRLEVIE